MTSLLALAAATSAPTFPVARAAQAVTPVATTPGYASAFVALLLVVGLILGLSWLLKRLPGNTFNGVRGLRPVASLAVGAKERLVVVEVGGEQLLIGVSPAGIQLLRTLPQPLPESSGSTVDFSALLGKHLAAKLPGGKERAA